VTTATSFTVEAARQDIVITRVFDALCELVFKTFTDPAAIPHWWGPRRLTTTVDVMEVRPGGRWRYVQRDSDGSEYAFHGVYHEVVAPERVVSTFEFEGVPGHVVLDTVTFEDLQGKTRVTTRSVFQSVEDRDEMVHSRMQSGATESWERMAELLARA